MSNKIDESKLLAKMSSEMASNPEHEVSIESALEFVKAFGLEVSSDSDPFKKICAKASAKALEKFITTKGIDNINNTSSNNNRSSDSREEDVESFVYSYAAYKALHDEIEKFIRCANDNGFSFGEISYQINRYIINNIIDNLDSIETVKLEGE